jgi:RNA polymerase sigma-70 factor (ECF subfamily)
MPLPSDPDRSVVERLQSGDDTALEEIMARYKRPILEFTYRMLGSAEDAEDVAQETFVKAYRHIRSYRPRALFSTWLFQIARNAALDRARQRARRGIFQSLEKFGADSPDVGLARQGGKSPATDLQALETGEAVARAVAALPEDQRTVIVLAEYNGMSHAEIAAVMKCSERAVEGRLYRAKQFLQKQLQHLL